MPDNERTSTVAAARQVMDQWTSPEEWESLPAAVRYFLNWSTGYNPEVVLLFEEDRRSDLPRFDRRAESQREQAAS